MIWFGWLSDISQLASRVGGGGGGVGQSLYISLHYMQSGQLYITVGFKKNRRKNVEVISIFLSVKTVVLNTMNGIK
jgi:hypothetical protein